MMIRITRCYVENGSFGHLLHSFSLIPTADPNIRKIQLAIKQTMAQLGFIIGVSGQETSYRIRGKSRLI
jgi:hypothetical protein